MKMDERRSVSDGDVVLEKDVANTMDGKDHQ